jgi:nucleoside-diphosphate-sugar epimerase
MNTDNFWKGKKVLVTGGTGFLGSYIVDTLISKGAYLKVIDFRKPSAMIGNIEFWEGDIRNIDLLFDLCKGIDYVFHLAAMPSIARGKPQDYYSINVKGTQNLLDAAYHNNVRKVMHVSSSTVYGIPNCFPLKENSPLKPIGKYGKSKLEAENVCRRFMDRGMNISIIRPRVIIGPGRIGIFSILFSQVAKGDNVYILGKGNNIFQFTHVSDMTNACLAAAQKTGSDLFNVGCDDIRPVKEQMLNLIKHAKSKSRIVCIPSLPARFLLRTLNILGVSPLVDEQFMIADKNFKLDTSYAQEKLKWKPRYSNLDSLLQAYDWYMLHRNETGVQYKSIFSVFGKFKHSRMGGFQS